MPTSLNSMPYDILFITISYLRFDDFCNLGRACKQLKTVLSEEGLCRRIVKEHLSFSSEAKLANDGAITYRSVIQRVFNRREAYATASPVSVAVLGYGRSFQYRQGVLCYTTSDTIRVLDLQHSAKVEQVIQLPALIRSKINHFRENRLGTLQLLHYSDSIISCLYQVSKPIRQAFLLVIRVALDNTEPADCLIVQPLESMAKLFVRNDRSYLYYGTFSRLGAEGHRGWLVSGISLVSRCPLDRSLQLHNFSGSEIDVTNCFAIHDGFFYAVDTQSSFESEEVDWTSKYHCLRFPVDCPCRNRIQRPEPIWRRQHQEGPINDSWTDLRLHVDEATNGLYIVESRREWQGGASSSQRTHYIQPLSFPPMSDATSDIPKDEYAEDIMVSSSWTGDDLVTPLIEPCGEPSPPPSTWRPQRYKHTSDDAEPMVKSFVLTKTKLRCYNPSCSSFLDIVDDAVGQLADNNGLRLRQRLRIRAGSRKPAPTRYDDSGMLLLANVDGDSDRELDEREDEWISRGVRMWPDSDDDESYSLLNSTPAAEGADVDGTADERSIVYLAGPLRGHDRAMVLINFDAGIKLGGLRTRETIHSVSPLKSMTLLQPDGPTMACSKKGHLDGVLRFHAQQRMESDDVEKWSREEEAWYTRLGKGMWLL